MVQLALTVNKVKQENKDPRVSRVILDSVVKLVIRDFREFKVKLARRVIQVRWVQLASEVSQVIMETRVQQEQREQVEKMEKMDRLVIQVAMV